MLVHVDIIFAISQGPYSDIELPSFKEQGSFYVLLDDTTRELGTGVHKPLNLLKVGKYFYASALVSI